MCCIRDLTQGMYFRGAVRWCIPGQCGPEAVRYSILRDLALSCLNPAVDLDKHPWPHGSNFLPQVFIIRCPHSTLQHYCTVFNIIYLISVETLAMLFYFVNLFKTTFYLGGRNVPSVASRLKGPFHQEMAKRYPSYENPCEFALSIGISWTKQFLFGPQIVYPPKQFLAIKIY